MIVLVTALFSCGDGWAISPFNPAGATAHNDNPVKTAKPGSGYRSEQESFVGNCLEGSETFGGKPSGSFTFENSLSEKEASNELGLGMGGRARFGAVKTSAEARFVRNTTSNQYSLSAVWISDYHTPTKQFQFKKLSPVGDAVKDHDERWSQTCGDRYVAEVDQGAKLFFSIRVEFVSKERKEEFAAKFRLAGPLYAVNSDLKKASKEFSRDSKVIVSAYQVGGDVSKLTGLFGNSEKAREGFIECTLGSFEACAGTIKSALDYAADKVTGFPSQIAPGSSPGPADLEYRTQPYEIVGKFPRNYPFLDKVNAEARTRLHDIFEEQFRYLVLSNRLLTLPLAIEKRGPIEVENAKVDSNVSVLLASSEICYNQPLNCNTAVASLNIQKIEESIFLLPPLATASFRIMTTSKGVWSRRESIAFMKSRYPSTPNNPAPPQGLRIGCRLPNITLSSGRAVPVTGIVSAGREEASIVVQIDGFALKEALLYFESTLISNEPIDLQSSERKAAGKLMDNAAIIVIDTTRGNPFWRDVNTDSYREKVWETEIKKADGTFRLIVRDLFGRETRFDLEYQNWEHHTCKDSSPSVEEYSYSFRNRRWEEPAGGMDLSKEGPYSDEGNYLFTKLSDPH